MEFSVSLRFLCFLVGLCCSQALSFPPTTLPPTTIVPGCYDGMKLYPVGANVMEGLCPKYCRASGKWQYVDTFECIFGYKSTTSPKTTVPKTTVPKTTVLKTTVPSGCFYRLRWYSHGDVVRYVGCEVKFCDHGNVRSIRLPCTTPPPSTTTRPTNCFFNNKWYRNGDRIPSQGCAYKYCHFGAVRTVFLPCTRPPTTIRPTPGPPSKSDGCFYNGRWYKPWERVASGDCWGSYCHPHSNMVTRWDSCGKTTPYPKYPTTMPFGCFENGRWYAPGAKISRGQSGNWCHGSYCSQGGMILHWDKLCRSTTLPPPRIAKTTPPATPTPPSTATRPPTTTCGGNCHLYCYKDGQLFPKGKEMSRRTTFSPNGQTICYGSYCGDNGKEIFWKDPMCGKTTPLASKVPTTPAVTSPPTTTPHIIMP